MELDAILPPQRTRQGVSGGSKKRVLQSLALCLAEDLPILDAEDLFRSLIDRERLGSTGIGYGVAIPHCRVANCTDPVGALFTLEQPVDFDAIDNQPVDIVFALLAPEEESDHHLQALATLAERFNDPAFRDQVRSAHNDQALYEIAIGHPAN